MDLSTKYLGLDLPHPLMPGASPLVEDLDTVRRLEDAGAAAIVMNSLFEEQIVQHQLATHEAMEEPANVFAEALTYFPELEDYRLGPDQYLEQLQRIKQAVGVPVIASLNGRSSGGWVEYARLIEQAGADALELNVYDLATETDRDAGQVESKLRDLVRQVRQGIAIPLAVKLSPFYTSLPNLAQRLTDAGADALVLFNRFYQPDIDLEELEVNSELRLSDSTELLLRLRWLAVLSGRVRCSLGVTGGVHTAADALKAVMTGAHAVQIVSELLVHGPQRLAAIRQEMAQWLEEHEYDSLSQAQGSMNLMRSPNPDAFERANYVKLLQGYKV